MIITVTAKDIADARATDLHKVARTQSCPVARAIKRRFPHVEVSVTGDYARVFQLHGKEVKHDLPSKVTLFVYRFDRGLVVEPFSFDLT